MARYRFVLRGLTAVPEDLVYLRGVRGGGQRSRRDDQLDRVHGTRPDLNLLGRSVIDQIPTLDPRHQLWIERQDSVEPQDVGDEIVGEHREAIQVAEVGDAGSVQIGGGNLRALEERHRASVIQGGVGKAAPLRQRLHEPHRRSVSAVDDSGE